MGNRGVITCKADLTGVGLYLHWNGGRASVEGFLAYCKLKGYRTPDRDNYGWAYLAGVCTNFFGDGLSCGLDIARELDCDNYDNGVFLIENWIITGRMFRRGSEQYDYELRDVIEGIDNHMPEKMRLTAAEWEKFDEVAAAVMDARKTAVDYDRPRSRK